MWDWKLLEINSFICSLIIQQIFTEQCPVRHQERVRHSLCLWAAAGAPSKGWE